METAVQRNSPVNVPSQISGILLNRIQTGEYQPGKSLPSVRSLTREFSVSPVTIMRSLDILEEAGVVLRNQGKGVFVSPEIQQNIHRRIAFCFPPEKFEPETVGAECWALASEFYRGLLAGAADEKAEVSFLQFPYECSETEKKQYLRQLSGFDVIIVEGVLILLNSSLKLKTVADNASLQNCAVSSENISESIKIKREFGFYLKANA